MTTPTTTAADINLKGARAFINGHYYVATYKGGTNVNWDDAQGASLATTLIGTDGYLATVYSHAENEFIYTQSDGVNFNLNFEAFLGGSMYGEVSGQSAGNFYWQWDPNINADGIKFWNGHKNGSAVSGMYTNWGNSEPNDSGGNEDFLIMWSSYSGAPSKWNDGRDAKGYITEWGVSGSSQYILGFDTAAPINAHEASTDDATKYGSVKVNLNKYVLGNYVYDKPLIAIPLAFGGSAVHNQDYTVAVKAETGQGSTIIPHALASFSSATTNPFGLSTLLTTEGTVTSGYTQPTLVDIDHDNDLDLVTGTYGGSTDLFLNTGSATAPHFAGAAYFGLPDFASYSSPSLVDIDHDGDLDAFIGAANGTTTYFKNNGSASAYNFSTASTSSFGLTDVGDFASPTFVDIDGDRDLDAFIGNSVGNVVFFRNTGTNVSPAFAGSSNNPFGLGGYTAYKLVAPRFVDIDNDGDPDAFIGHGDGKTLFFRNTGTASAASFANSEIVYGQTNLGLYTSSDGDNLAPTFGDLDGDGDLDAFIGNNAGNFIYQRNDSKDILYVKPSGSTYDDQIRSVTLQIKPINNSTRQEPRDVTITLGSDVGVTLAGDSSTYHIYSFDSTTAYSFGSSSTQQLWIIDDEPTLSLGQGLSQKIYTNFSGSSANTLDNATAAIAADSSHASTLFDVNGIDETDGASGTFSACGLSDHFGVRWEGYIRIPQTGRYVFRTLSDDGVKLNLRSNNSTGGLLGSIDNWTVHASAPNDTSSVDLNAGDVVWMQMDYYENTGNAAAKLSWIITPIGGSQFAEVMIPATALFLSEAAARGSGQGLHQSLYPTFDGAIAGSSLNNTVASSMPVDVNGINESDSTFGAQGLVDIFGVRWEGYIRIPQSGSYQFQTISDDGVRLSLRQANANGNSLAAISSSTPYSIDNWTLHGSTVNTTSSVSLNQGDVVWVQMDFFEEGGSAVAVLNWIRPLSSGGSVTEVIPANALFLSEAAARGSGQGLVEPTSGEATGTAFTIYSNQPASNLNVNVGFTSTNGTTTINSGNAQRGTQSSLKTGDDYAIYTDSSALSGSKLLENPQITSWSPTDSALGKDLYYRIYHDDYAEASEAITMTLAAGTGYGVSSGTMATTLYDQPLTLSIEGVENPSEGEAGWVTIRSRLNGAIWNNPIENGLMVKYRITTGGTAIRNTDYLAPKATLSTTAFNAQDLVYLPYGASETKLYISALADAIHEGNETITLELLNSDQSIATNPGTFTYQSYLVDAGKASATVTILDSTTWSPGVAITPPNRTGTATIRATVNSTNQQQASVDVHLLSQPKADVTVALASTSGSPSLSTITFTPSNWSTPHSVTITGLSDSVNTTLSATTSSSGDSFYSGKTASQTIIPFGSTSELPLTLWEGGSEEPLTPTVTVSTLDSTEGSTDAFGFTLNLDAPRVDSDLEVFFSLVAGSGFQLSGHKADVTTTPHHSYNPLLLKGGSAYADLGSFSTVGTGGVFSAEAWVRPDSTSTANTAVLEFSDASGANEIMLGFVAGSLTPLLTLANSSGTSIGTISGSPALVAGQWNHLAFSIDSNHTASLYLNGSLVASALLSATPPSKSRSHNRVGESSRSTSGFLNGAVRDARVWNTSRSAEQIQASMLSSDASGSNLIGAWSLNNSGANAVLGGSAAALVNSATFEATTTYGAVIPVGASRAAVQFTAIDDASDEGRESVSLSLKGSGRYGYSANSFSSAYLDDNDTAGVVFSLFNDEQDTWTVATSATTSEGDASHSTSKLLGITLATEPSIDPGQGLSQTIYPTFVGSGTSTLPSSSTPAPVLIDADGINESDSGPNSTFSTYGLVDNFGVRWEGFIRVPQTGTYQFQTFSDDGVRLALKRNNANGTSLAPINSSTPYSIDNWTNHAGTTNTSSILTLNAGDVVWMQMDFYEAGGSALAQLKWIRTPSGGVAVTELIPATALFLTELGARGTATNSDVTIAMDPNSGEPDQVTVAGNTSLTFSANNWNMQQTLGLQGVDNSNTDGNSTTILRFGATAADSAYAGMQTSFGISNVDDDAIKDLQVTPSSGSSSHPVVSIAAANPVSLTEGGTGTSSFSVILNQASATDTVVFFDLDRKVGNALDHDVAIQPNAGSSIKSGLTLVGQLAGGHIFTQVDPDGINESKASFGSLGLTAPFSCTWSGWVRIDRSGSYSFQTHMTDGSITLIVGGQQILAGATVDGVSPSLSLTGGTFVPIALVYTTSSNATNPTISLSWSRPTSTGESVTELLPANLLQRVAGRHVVIPSGSTSGGFNVTVVNDNVAEGVVGVSNQENLVLTMLDPLPVEIVVSEQSGSAQAATLTLGLGSSREESYALAVGTVLPLMVDASDSSTIRAYFTVTQAVTLHRDFLFTVNGTLHNPSADGSDSGSSYSGTMASLVNLVSMTDATGTYIGIDPSVSIQAISNWQPSNFSPSSLGAFGLPVQIGGYVSPTFVDIDADGDQDAFIGVGSAATTLFYRNTGSASRASFSASSQGAFGLPANTGSISTPSFVDIDADGDPDAFIGNQNGNILFFRNSGTSKAAAFAGSSIAFGLTLPPSSSTIVDAAPSFVDIDHDGDFDAFVGNSSGNTLFFRNTGNNTSPLFASPSTNPFGISKVNGDAAPAFLDFDRDGDFDLFLGKTETSGTSSDLTYFRNTGNASSPAFASAVTNAFGLPHVGSGMARPAFVDIDADGNVDAFIGYANGSTLYFQGNSSIDLALEATNRSSVTLSAGTVLSYPTPLPEGGTQNLNLTLRNAITLEAPSGHSVTGTAHTASVGVSNDSGSTAVASILGDSTLVQVSPTLQVTLIDNDTPGVFISSDAAGLTAASSAVISLSEPGVSTDRWIRLNSQPTETVTVYVQTSDLTEVLLQPDSGGIGVSRLGLTFTVEHWNVAQKVTLQPQNDHLVDGPISLTINTSTHSNDPFYNSITGASLNVSVSDDDTAGLRRSLLTSTLSQGSNGFLTLQLNAQPTADVTVTLTPSDTQFTINERGVGQAESLVFTPDDWSVTRKVGLKVVNDTVFEDITHSQLSFTTESNDSHFNRLSVTPVSIDIVDNDLPTASIQLGSNSTEEAAPGSFRIKLSSPASSSSGSDGVVVNYIITSLTLDPDLNYSSSVSSSIGNIVQVPAVSGQVRIAPGSDTSDAFVVPIDDFLADNPDKQFVVSLDSGTGYQFTSGASSSSATVRIINNDQAGVAIITTGNRAATTEGDTSATGGEFQVVLLSQPSDTVRVILTESAADSTRQLGTANSTYSQTLYFNPDDWYIPQSTSVYAYDDDRIAVQNGSGTGFEREDSSRPNTGYQTAQIAYRFESTDTDYNSDSHVSDTTHFTTSTLQTVDVMDRALSADTDIALNNSLILLQDGIETLGLPMVGVLEGKVGSLFRGFLHQLVERINSAGRPAASQLKKLIEDNIPAFNGVQPTVVLSMDANGSIRVKIEFQGEENLFSVPLATDLGTPALGFQANGSIDAVYSYSAAVSLVFPQSGDIYLDTNPANTYVNATFAGGIPDDFSMSGGLGMLQVIATNKVSENSHIGSHNTGIDVQFSLDLFDSAGLGSDGMLTYSELTSFSSTALEQLVQFDVGGDATLSMGIVSGNLNNPTMPKISFDMATHYDLFDYSDEAEATAEGRARPIYFDDITLDLGSYVTGSIKKTVDFIDKILTPLYPVIDALNADTHIFKTLGIANKFDVNNDGKVSVLEVAQTYASLFPASLVTENESDGHNLSTAIDATVEFLTKLTKVADLVRTLEDDTFGGDLDMFLGNAAGNTLYFYNSGVVTDPGFSSSSNFGLPSVGTNASPFMADIDNDGDLDAFIGDGSGSVHYYPNTGENSKPSYDVTSTTIAHLLPFDVGTNASPVLVDIDSDGDLDLFVGNGDGNTLFYRNPSTNKGYFDATSFSSVTINPFGLGDVGSNAAPYLVDIDADGDLDAFIGNSDGNTLFYRNTGGAASPAFSAVSTNPFRLADVGSNASPVFVDIEDDGDLDAFIGNGAGNIIFFQNTGSASSAAFSSPATNPFHIINTSTGNAKPFFADIDADSVFNINLGSFEIPALFSASHVDANSTAYVPVTSSSTPYLQTNTASQANVGGSQPTQSGAAVGGPSSSKLSSYMAKLDELGFSIGIVDDPKNVVKLLLNQEPLDIFSWTLPSPGLDFNIEESFDIVSNLVDGLFLGDLHLGASLGFGFDTYGLKEWRDSGFKSSDAWKVVDGFYFNDIHDGTRDLPEFTFSASVAAGLGLVMGLVRSDIIGGLLGTASFNLLDHPDASGHIDYRIRPSDFMGSQQELLSLFQLDGEISAYLDARVDVGVDLGFVDSWTKVWEDTLSTYKIFGFDYSNGQLATSGGVYNSISEYNNIVNTGQQAVGTASSTYSVALEATSSFSTTGTASNGYLSNSTVFWDGNYNSRIDASESWTTTTTDGVFQISLEPRSHDTNHDGFIAANEGQLVAMGGVDTSINQSLMIPLVAPFGTMVTPLTTLHGLGLRLGANPVQLMDWINGAFDLRGFQYLGSDPVLHLSGQATGISGGTGAQMGYLAHAKVHFAFNQLLSTLQSIEPLLLKNNLGNQLELMGHVAKALFSFTPTTPINDALARALTDGTEAWIASLSPPSGSRNAAIARDVARHASITIQEFGRLHDQVAASFRDGDGPAFLAAINAVKTEGFHHFRSAMSELTADIQSFATTEAFLETLHSRLVASEVAFAAPEGIDISGSGVTSENPNGTYTAGSVITILVPFTDAVTVTGSPTLLLHTGTTMRRAVYSEGSGSSLLSFTYTVETGDSSADLDYASSVALELSGGTIKDSFGDNADLTLPTPGGPGSLGVNADLVIDALAPTISSSNPAYGASGVLEAATIELTFSEAVRAGAGTIELLRADGTTVESFDVASGIGSAGGTLLFNGASLSLDPFASLLSHTAYSLTIPASSITDVVGNVFAGLLEPNAFHFSTGDSIAPTVSAVTSVNADGTYGIGARITLSLRFSEAVTVTTQGALPSLLLETGAIDHRATYHSGSGTDTLTFAYIVEAGDVSADLDYFDASALALNGSSISDAAGNNAILSLPAPGAPGSLAANAALVISGIIPQSLSISTGTPAVTEGSSISVALSSDTLAAGAPIFWTFSGEGITAGDVSPSGLSGSLNLGSDQRAAFSRSISLDGITEGDEFLTLSFFSDAKRSLSLGQALFTLRDLVPAGVAGATDGRDQITGTAADELISGVPTGSVLHGRGSYDTLIGNGGNDIFILGTASTVFYNDGKANTTGAADLAAITDFTAADRIQLKGGAADYRLSSGALAGASGAFLHWRAAAGAGSSDETIAFVQGLTPSALSLTNTNQFLYL